MNLLRGAWRPRRGLSQADVLGRVDDDVRQMIGRGRFAGDGLGVGPNWVHAVIGRGFSGEHGEPGTFEDLGWSKNLKTNAGMNWLHAAMGGLIPLGTQVVCTGATGTSFTVAGTPWTANQLTGMRVVSPITGITTAPVYGNIGQNTTSVIQVDQWWTAVDGVGTTPSTGNHMLIMPGMGPARFIGLATGSCTPAVGNTTIASSGGTEAITMGMSRALALYAHTTDATTFTQYKLFTATGAIGPIGWAGLFTALGPPATCAGTMVAITALNAAATLADTDTLAITWTFTLPAAG